MALSAALHIGQTGLLASQAALEVVGNNLANLATPGYHRQSVNLAPSPSQEIQKGVFAGRGVQLQSIVRRIDEALEARLRGSIASQSYSLARQELLGQLEAIQNEFTDSDISSKLSDFFNAWSGLANNPTDLSLRTLVSSEAQTLSRLIQRVRSELSNQRSQADRSAASITEQVNSLLNRIEGLNSRISSHDGRTNRSTGLRDQRDLLLGELGQYLDISTLEHHSGELDIFVGSRPIILNGDSRGVDLRFVPINGEIDIELVVDKDKSPLDLSSGKLGAIVSFRKQDLAEAINALDTFANELAFQVNRLHSQGQGTQLFDNVTGSVQLNDATLALTDPALDLDFTPTHGSFLIHVTNKTTGERVATTISIDLDGINPAMDTTLTSLAADLDAVENITTSVTTDHRIQIASGGGDYQISFSEDSSNVLASLGINTFFVGGQAHELDVNPTLIHQPMLIAAALDHMPGDNRTSLAIAALRDQVNRTFGGSSINGFWNRHVSDFATRLAQAKDQVEADSVVRDNLEAQKASVSGVNVDEEAISLLQFQRAYQANARFISVVDELYQTLLTLV